MRYWLDTEFIEDGKTIDLISIGIVCEDGREFYRLNYDCNYSRANEWVKANVLNLLPSKPIPQIYLSEETFLKVSLEGWRNKDRIADEIKEFCSPEKYGKPEFWAYYADYDWVVFCQLFGTMTDLPKGFPMYCRDIKQECDRLGNPKLPDKQSTEHNALNDAKWNKLAYYFLQAIAAGKEEPPFDLNGFLASSINC